MNDTNVIGAAALCLAAYLLGSVNAALAAARARGVDIRAEGSGNPGASNVLRVLGPGPAAAVYTADLAKGFLPALAGALVWDQAAGALAGLWAVIGHCYPVFHRFRGGKGVAAAGGAVLALAPLAMLAMAAVYAAGLKLSRISAVGSLAAVLAAPPALLLAGADARAAGWCGAMTALIVWRHRTNLMRLRAGAEHRLL